MRTFTVPVGPTDTSEDGVSALISVPGGGYVEAIDFLHGTLTSDTGTTLAVTDECNGISNEVLSITNPGTTDIRLYPRILENDNTDGTELATYTRILVIGSLKLTVAGAGAAKSGSVKVHVSNI